MSKQVKIYPIEATLTKDGRTVKIQILKLAQQGCMVNSLEEPLRVNDNMDLHFVLPIRKVPLSVRVLIYKTYDEFKGKHGLIKPGHHVNEVLFKELRGAARKHIHEFVAFIHPTKSTPKSS